MSGALQALLRAAQTLFAFSGHGLALLIEVTVKGSFFLLSALFLTLALRRASAGARHLVWTLALGAMLLLPIFSLTLPAWNLRLIRVAEAEARGERNTISEGSIVVSRNHQFNSKQVVRPASAAFKRAVRPAGVEWILSFWAIGWLLLAARLISGEVRACWLVKRSRPLTTGEALFILENLRTRLHISRAVALRSSTEVAIPFTRGTLRPTVVLPAGAREWSRTQLAYVLAHEMAHVRRFDYLTQLAAQVACAVFWFHPLVWLAALEMRRERERACDDAVLSLGHRAADYGEFLLALSRSLQPLDGAWLTGVGMAQSSQLEVRMRVLLDPKLNHKPLAARHVLLATVMAASLLLPVAAVRATAKNATGSVSGTVHDPSGAVIPEANVTLVNMDLQQRIFGHTGEDGAFAFPAIPAGRYRLEIASPGFAYTKSADFELKASSDLHQDVTMDIGELIQEVVVHGHKPAENRPTPSQAPRRIRVGGNVQSAKLTYQPKPDYPAGAAQQGIEGTVILRAVIGMDGQVLSLAPYNDADPDLIKAAMDAVRQWRYQPTLLNGVPVEVVTTITVVFRLDG
jgi:TonB family protein